MAKLGTKECPRCGGSGRIPDETVGPTMKAIRLRARVPVQKLARALDKSRTYVSDLEAGKRNWSPELIEMYQVKVRELAA